MKVAEIATTCAVVIFRVKMSCIKLRSFKILLVIFQLSRYVIGYKVTVIGALQVANIITMAVQNAHNYLHYLYTATEFNVSYLSMKSDRP